MSVTEKFEHYEVLKREDGSLFELGRGAMGITYKALDTDLECFVALKIISPATIANKDSEQRFLREARIAAQLRHPNIASVFRLGETAEGAHYYAMEFCEGQTVQQLVEQSGPIECRRALQFTLQITKALIVAEERHLVHRDLKPSNLIITQRSDEGEVIKVIDFGLAKTTTPEGTMWSSAGTHGFIGTAHFASPEQIEDKPVDTRSDIYSLGSTLWFMLIGKPPFEGSLARIMSQHLTAEPDVSHLVGVPEKVIALIRRMLEKSAEDRPQSAAELRREIIDCLEIAEEKKDEAVDPKAALPAAEPPASEAPPKETWAPSLQELLRVRSVLSPAEAFCIGDVLAAKLDKAPESSQGALLVQDITIHFQDSPTAEQTRARLRENPATWPAFDLTIKSGDAPLPLEPVDASLMVTIVPGEDDPGDNAQQLARLLYDLLGGVAGSRYVPVARLGEAGNAVLQRATIVGLAGYPTLRGLLEKLREAVAVAPAQPVAASVRPAAPVAPKPEARPPAAPRTPEKQPKSTAPLQPSQPSIPAPLKPRVASSSAPPPLPPQSSPKSTPTSTKAKQSSGAGMALRILAGAVGLIAVFGGIKTIQSGLSKGHGAMHSETPPPSGPTPDSPTPTDSPTVPPPFQGAQSAPRPTATAPTAIQFTIYDDLDVGQISESVRVYLDGQAEPAASLNLTPQDAHGAAVVNLPQAGHHAFRVETESVVLDTKKGVRKKFVGSGHWDNDFHGGEKFDLHANPKDDGDIYDLDVIPRN